MRQFLLCDCFRPPVQLVLEGSFARFCLKYGQDPRSALFEKVGV
jgi:hypothetical protein